MRTTVFPLSRILVVSLFLLTAIIAQRTQNPPTRSRQLQQIDSVKSLPTKSKRWALVIGVDKYADTQITTLGGASNDARALAGALVKYAGFPPDQVTLLASDQPEERQPSRGHILRQLSNMASYVPPDGLLLVSFAGHGMERSNRAFLLPSDAQVSNDVDLLELTAINVSQIKDYIRKIGVGQVILILDACRNDPVGRANADNPLTPAYLRGFNFDVRNKEVTAFATLYATAVGQRAYEYKEKHQGYFTWELVEGLKGGAANERGEITLEGLLRYLQERVPKHVLADLGGGKDQRPFAEIGGYRAERLVLALAPGANAQPTSGSGLPGIAKVDPAAFELAYWDTIKNSADAEDFKLYLSKYPNGQFADLARRRVESLTAANRDPGSGPSETAAPSKGKAQLGVSVKDDRIVAELQPGGPADRAGIRAGDRLVSVQGALISSAANLQAEVSRYHPGDVIEVLYERGGVATKVAVTLGAATGDTTSATPSTPGIQLSDVLTLGINLGMAEVASYQNAASASVQQYLTYAQTVGARNGIGTFAIDSVLNQLRNGATPASQYQSLLAARQGLESSLNRNCNCGYAVNLNSVFTLGAQIGFLEIITYQNGDRKQVEQLLTLAVQFAGASGLQTTEFEDLLRKVRGGKHGMDIYNSLVALHNKLLQTMNRMCSC